MKTLEIICNNKDCVYCQKKDKDRGLSGGRAMYCHYIAYSHRVNKDGICEKYLLIKKYINNYVEKHKDLAKKVAQYGTLPNTKTPFRLMKKINTLIDDDTLYSLALIVLERIARKSIKARKLRRMSDNYLFTEIQWGLLGEIGKLKKEETVCEYNPELNQHNKEIVYLPEIDGGSVSGKTITVKVKSYNGYPDEDVIINKEFKPHFDEYKDKWRINITNNRSGICKRVIRYSSNKYIMLNRYILSLIGENIYKGERVRYKDGNSLNLSLDNMEIVLTKHRFNHIVNRGKNGRKNHSTGHPNIYKRESGRFQTYSGKKNGEGHSGNGKCLGTFDTIEEALEAQRKYNKLNIAA